MNLRMWYPILLILLLASGVSFFSLELGITLFLLGSVLSIIGRIIKTHGKVTLNIDETKRSSDLSLFQEESTPQSSFSKAKTNSALEADPKKASSTTTSVASVPDAETTPSISAPEVHGIDKSVFSKFQNSLEKASQIETTISPKIIKKKDSSSATKPSAPKSSSPKLPPLTSDISPSQNKIEGSQEKVTLSSHAKSLAPKSISSPKKAVSSQKKSSSENVTYSKHTAQTSSKKLDVSPIADDSKTVSSPGIKNVISSSKTEKSVLPKALQELQVPSNFSDPKIKISQEKLLNSLQIPEAEMGKEGDLFADVHIHLEGDPLLSEENAEQSEAVDPLYDEGLSHFLSRVDSAESTNETRALLELAQKFFDAQKWLDAQASLNMYLEELQKMGEKPDQEVIHLQVQIANKVEKKQKPLFENKVKATEPTDVPSKIPSNTSDKEISASGDYVVILEELASTLEKRKAHQELLPILHDLLNYHRQQLNRLEMDRIYERIERTLEALGETERLLRTYKSHLEIKRVLKDRYGESMLLDLIGIHHYKMGNSEQSQHYYEENLRVKASIAREGQNVVMAE